MPISLILAACISMPGQQPECDVRTKRVMDESLSIQQCQNFAQLKADQILEDGLGGDPAAEGVAKSECLYRYEFDRRMFELRQELESSGYLITITDY